MNKFSKLVKVRSLRVLIRQIILPITCLITIIFLNVGVNSQENDGTVNLLESAPDAVWSSGAGRLLFGGSTNDRRGFATYREGGWVLEDDSWSPVVLETHPRWTDGGLIRGEFYIPRIQSGQHLMARIGFIQPVGSPRTNGVTVKILFNGFTVYDDIKLYTRALNDIDVDMSRFNEQSGTLILEVGTNGDSTQDWLIWVNPRLGYP